MDPGDHATLCLMTDEPRGACTLCLLEKTQGGVACADDGKLRGKTREKGGGARNQGSAVDRLRKTRFLKGERKKIDQQLEKKNHAVLLEEGRRRIIKRKEEEEEIVRKIIYLIHPCRGVRSTLRRVTALEEGS